MKIAVLGATGWIGSTIVEQASKRGHDVISIVRDAAKVPEDTKNVRVFDLQSQEDITPVLENIDLVIASIGGRAAGNHELVADTAERLLTALDGSKNRILWVGGAGSLEVAPGVQLVTTPDFPAEYKAEALAQGEALDKFKHTSSSVNWTFVSPAASIYPGESEGAYRIGGDEFFTNDAGESKISVTDYALAMLDEAENAAHLNQRISVAY
ncbi:NAD(P)-dependent oxidoreductase [Paraglaciecola aquimarina]|uniref:NAD(P)-dependent oxidoreductase n=1 Tax=Paraglaciecola aquimarina TaxID=1235557 RepID=A0ABU3SUP0_9ALTE|nr:NAD(P)-dependent oxidoreductase [Paraglaciecola aquimarina]MDU0353728.1 NAD(P)-dependent oxidoreductase [Paraglaciecola aquimarina]